MMLSSCSNLTYIRLFYSIPIYLQFNKHVTEMKKYVKATIKIKNKICICILIFLSFFLNYPFILMSQVKRYSTNLLIYLSCMLIEFIGVARIFLGGGGKI